MRLDTILFLLLASFSGAQSMAQNPAFSAERMAEAEITVEELAGGLYVFFGIGGNMLVSIGNQGVLIVDDQFPEMAPKYRAMIRELGGADIDFAINTHWHYDHADGNKLLGPEGTWLVSQANSREMLTKTNVINTVVRPLFTQNPYETAALPVFVFDDRMRMHFNELGIDLFHFGPAHTTGDAAVVVREHNVVHLGDVFNSSGYPFIDADNGGDLNGMIDFCSAILEELPPGAIVVPGHGPVGRRSDLEAYVGMLSTIRDRIARLIAEGATLEQVIAAEPTADWDAQMGDPTRMIDRAYASLSR